MQWPKVGIFAQRAKSRPNRIGATICQLISVQGLVLRVRSLDALDGSPVLDIKPVFAEFLPERGSVRQPSWSHEMMARYFGFRETAGFLRAIPETNEEGFARRRVGGDTSARCKF